MSGARGCSRRSPKASLTASSDSLAYDKAGRPIYSTQHVPGDTTTYGMTYTYDSTGHLINRTAPPLGSAARWVYRKLLGIIDTVCGAGTCAAFARDSELKPDTITFNAEATGSWKQRLFYGSLHRVTSDNFSATDPQANLTSAWTYDSVNRVVSGAQSVGTYPREIYTYDAAGNLINACQKQTSISNCKNEYNQDSVSASAYDSAANRIDTTAHAIVGGGNRVTQFKGYGFTYDLNGDITQRAGLGPMGIWNNTDTTTFRWNAMRQLTRVDQWAGGAHTVVTFRYDAMGRRVGKWVNGVTTWFIYDGGQVVLDVNSATHALRAEYAFDGGGRLMALRKIGRA